MSESPMTSRIRGHSRDAAPVVVVQRGCFRVTITVRRAPKSRPSFRPKSNLTNFQPVPPLSPPLPSSKTQFRETRDFTTGAIPSEFLEIAPLSRLIHPICPSPLCEISLLDRLSEIGQYRSLKEKASLKASFFQQAIFSSRDLNIYLAL